MPATHPQYKKYSVQLFKQRYSVTVEKEEQGIVPIRNPNSLSNLLRPFEYIFLKRTEGDTQMQDCSSFKLNGHTLPLKCVIANIGLLLLMFE